MMTWLDDFKNKEQRAIDESTRVVLEKEASAKKDREKEWRIRFENHSKIIDCAVNSNIETYLLDFAKEIMVWHPKCAIDASLSRGMDFWEKKNTLTLLLWKKYPIIKPKLLENFSYEPDQILKRLYWTVYLYSETAVWKPRFDNDPGKRTTYYGFVFSITENGLFFGPDNYKQSVSAMNVDNKKQIQEKIIQAFERANPIDFVYLP